MAEREADRANPDRLRRQAVAALVFDAGRKISTEFRRELREHDAAPGLSSLNNLAAVARSGLEVEIARNLDANRKVDTTAAVGEALRQLGEGYVREQKCQLVADRHPQATIASESVKTAFNGGALEAAVLILADRPAPKAIDRVRLTDDLLAPPSSGVTP
jgi:hypothetical protein